MKPLKFLLFFLIIGCSQSTTYTHNILFSDNINFLDTSLVIYVEDTSEQNVKVTVQLYPVDESDIQSYKLVFDMKFREDYSNNFQGICVGPRWEEFGPGEFTVILTKGNDFKNSINGSMSSNIDDRCANYFYYLRYLNINTEDGEIYYIGVATDYAEEYPDAPHVWKQNKINQIEEFGNSNIEKYSLNFELSK